MNAPMPKPHPCPLCKAPPCVCHSSDDEAWHVHCSKDVWGDDHSFETCGHSKRATIEKWNASMREVLP